MDKWNEFRTAYLVAEYGTVSAAADILGVHRATVSRHIEVLEEALGGKVFYRHARGYSLTEAGEDLLRVAKITEEQFNHLAGRIRGRSTTVSGELIVTSLEIIAPVLLQAIQRYREKYPEIAVRYQISEKLYNLEYGEAHVAVRAGPKPQQLSNVVQPFCQLKSALFAHKNYVLTHGHPQTSQDFSRHFFIAPERLRRGIGVHQWMHRHVDPKQIIFRSESPSIRFEALTSGIGICFCPLITGQSHPDLIQIMPSKKVWDASFWLVTHVDMNRTAKVQEFLKVLKQTPVE